MKEIKSENDWQNLIQSFMDNAHSIIEEIKNLPESQWSESFVLEKYGTYERNIEGLIEHSYYHFGQISLLLKIFKQKATSV